MYLFEIMIFFFLILIYGTSYGNNTGFGEKTIPVLHVYSSPDMITWVHHGPMIQNAPIGT